MTSVQERLQLKRMALDNWSTREKLCLASAVSCSGDQNWMSVSRSLKMLCGANRPADWFSQKSCAVQYGELLENVETPKRKKRTISERDNSITETPTESVLRRLTQERVAELKAQIQKDQEDYAKLREEILLVQSSNVNETQLKEIWAQIEHEQEQKIAEQQKYAQWLKEREDRKTELQRSWRPNTIVQAHHLGAQKPSTLSLNQKNEEMEVDDPNIKHGTAPLLTSLLKSTSPAPSSTSNIIHTTPATSTSVRMAAPTITNLLTGNTTQVSAVISTSTSNQQFHTVHCQPLTGPIPVETHQPIFTSPSQAAPTLSMLLENKKQEQQTPEVPQASQEKLHEIEIKSQLPEAMDIEEVVGSPNKDDDQQLMEVFNGLIPDNIDDLEDILTNNNAIILNPELLEEESILEDVEALMNDNNRKIHKTPSSAEQSDFLEQRQQNECTESKNLPESSDFSKIKDEIKQENENPLEQESVPKIEDSSGGGIQIEVADNLPDAKQACVEEKEILDNKQIIEVKEEEKEPEVIQKIESSDDSSDNTTLQTLKEKIQDDHKNEIEIDDRESPVEDVLMEITTVNSSAIENNDSNMKEMEVEQENIPNISNLPEVDVENPPENESTKNEKTRNDSPDVIVLTEDSDSNDVKSPAVNATEEENLRKSESPVKNLIEQIEEKDIPEKSSPTKITASGRISPPEPAVSSPQKETPIETELTTTIPEATATITIIDTDDDSPIEVVKDEKINKNKRDYSRARKSETQTEKKSEESNVVEENKQNLSIRKLKERDGSESPLVDDENQDAIPRTRRRYSSTPIIDSIPSSPASSDDREYKAWKKSILMIYNRIATHRHASIFLRPVTEEVAPNYKTIVFRPMNLHTIKKNIETGVIRTTIEFQRDVMLMCVNAIMYNKKDNNVYSMAKEMMTESVSVIESLIESVRRDSEKVHNNLSVKGRSRKSHRLP